MGIYGFGYTFEMYVKYVWLNEPEMGLKKYIEKTRNGQVEMIKKWGFIANKNNFESP